MPPISSDSQWKQLVEEFTRNSRDFIDWVITLTDEQLKDTFVQESYGTYQRNIMAVIEHSYYHLGQISLIKKLITT